MGLSSFERQYLTALENIYNYGYSDGTNERTGVATKRLPGVVFRTDVGKTFPTLQTKFVANKTALKEALWIWQQNSNNIKDLNAKIWDKWADEKGSIGKTYGYQIGKPVRMYLDSVHKDPASYRSYETQAHYVVEYLKEQPNGRQCVCTMWCIDDLADMNLVPCTHTTTWNLDGGRLNLLLDQRSGDMAIGVPIDVVSHAELMILFANHLGVEPGKFTHVIADAHIYENQMNGVALQLAYRNFIDHFYKITDPIKCAENIIEKYIVGKAVLNEIPTPEKLVENAMSIINYQRPEFKVNYEHNESKDFFKVNITDCHIPVYANMGTINFGDVAV